MLANAALDFFVYTLGALDSDLGLNYVISSSSPFASAASVAASSCRTLCGPLNGCGVIYRLQCHVGQEFYSSS